MRHGKTLLCLVSISWLVLASNSYALFLTPIPYAVPHIPQQFLRTSQRSFLELQSMGDRVAALGDYSQAESLYRAALVLLPERCADAGYLHDRIAQLNAERSDYTSAEREWTIALGILAQAVGSGSPAVAMELENLGWVNTQLHRLNIAIICYERALLIQEKTGAPKALRAATLTNMANICRQQNQRQRAEQLFKRAQSLLLAR
jgi:tetratricopeptide (TPR) repeat protein